MASSLAVAAIAVACGAMPSLGQMRYHAVPLGVGTTVGGINAAGDIVGSVVTSNGREAFLWRDGALLRLGTLGGTTSAAAAVNDRGEVAGQAQTADGRSFAFVWRNGQMLDLRALPGHDASSATGMNNAGWVVGWSEVEGSYGTRRAFVHDGRAIWDLGTLGGSVSAARAVNDAGQVVGEADTANRPPQAFLYERGAMLDLGDRGSFSTTGSATAINRTAQVAGYQNWISVGLPASFTDTWLYAAGRKTYVDCPRGRCFPSGLNDGGRMVGNFLVGNLLPNVEFNGAFVWDAVSGGAELEAPGWRITSAVGINNRGQIAAQGCDARGCQGLRLDPLSERRVVEYVHSGFGHYFITASAAEIAALDTAADAVWIRTGCSFNAWDLGAAPLQPVCRFWSDQSFAPRSSHFCTPYAHECELLKHGTTWRYEGEVFSLRLPEGTPGSKTCPSGSQPLYRAYNNNLPGAPNHRYMTDPALLDQMIAQGWTMEGEAGTRVFACAPVQE